MVLTFGKRNTNSLKEFISNENLLKKSREAEEEDRNAALSYEPLPQTSEQKNVPFGNPENTIQITTRASWKTGRATPESCESVCLTHLKQKKTLWERGKHNPNYNTSLMQHRPHHSRIVLICLPQTSETKTCTFWEPGKKTTRCAIRTSCKTDRNAAISYEPLPETSEQKKRTFWEP